jgi:hypothetical protein
MFSKEENGPFNQLENVATNVVEAVCATIARPLEMILRIHHGTRYFPVPVIFLSTLLMLFLPVASLFTAEASRIFPFAAPKAPQGLFGLGSFSKLYFLLCLVHGVRLWFRVLHPEREIHSEFEGPALPLFQLFPRSNKFWFCRIILEPCVVFAAALLLRRFLIVDDGLALYLQVAAAALAVKEWIGWFNAWEVLRSIFDTQRAAQILARIIDDRASDEDLATIHLAGFPKNISSEFRKSAVGYIARVFEVKNDGRTETA